MKHLLVTNDFPPKVGGIQSYLWELWRRLPADSTTVLTTPHEGSASFDAQQPFRIERDQARVLLPTKALARRVDALATDVGADLVLLDPAVPLGIIGPWLKHPYGVVLHGAEVTVPGRLPIVGRKLGAILRGAQIVISAGGYPAAEARRCAGRDLPTVIIPPGVDPQRFVPLEPDDRRLARIALGLDPDAPIILGLSRLVPRKGFDVLIEAGAVLAKRHPELQIVLAGSGRDRQRLERMARRIGSPVTFLGRVDDDDLSPMLASSDVFAMLCRNRWGGLEQEGFGIVFLEAAAAGVASVAGRSGGSAEAVDDGVTGVVVKQPKDIQEVVAALDRLLGDAELRSAMGRAGRLRAESAFTYDRLAAELYASLEKLGTNL
ncbi:RfaG Glycosyltransferase [Acidimicrobiia bacterium]